MASNNRYQPRYSNILAKDNTFSGTNTFSGNVVANQIQGSTGRATNAGSGFAAGTVTSSITKIGRVVYTDIFVDLAGTASSTTLNDVIGDDDAANAHIGQILVAESGVVYAGTMACLEVPTTGVADVDLYASSAATGAEDADASGLADAVQLVDSNAAWTLGRSVALTGVPNATSDYLYLAVGVAGTPGTYDAGQFHIRLEGYEA